MPGLNISHFNPQLLVKFKDEEKPTTSLGFQSHRPLRQMVYLSSDEEAELNENLTNTIAGLEDLKIKENNTQLTRESSDFEMEYKSDEEEENDYERLYPSRLTTVGPIKLPTNNRKSLNRKVSFGLRSKTHVLNVTDGGGDDCSEKTMPEAKDVLGKRSEARKAIAHSHEESHRI